MLFRGRPLRINEDAARHLEMEAEPRDPFGARGQIPRQSAAGALLVGRHVLLPKGQGQQKQLSPATGTADGRTHNLFKGNLSRKGGRIEHFAAHDTPTLDLRGQRASYGFHFGQFGHDASGRECAGAFFSKRHKGKGLPATLRAYET